MSYAHIPITSEPEMEQFVDAAVAMYRSMLERRCHTGPDAQQELRSLTAQALFADSNEDLRCLRRAATALDALGAAAERAQRERTDRLQGAMAGGSA